MKFSLVTTCLNEIESIGSWKSDIEAQTGPPDEIVIVDGESTDGTLEILKNWAAEDARVKIIVEKCNVARGRNLAIEAAIHDIIISTDMGVKVDRCWAEEMIKPFDDDDRVDVVLGNYAVDKSSIRSLAAKAEFAVTGNEGPFADDGKGGLTRKAFPSNRSVAYKKKVWRKLGGLPEDLTRCTDDSVFGRQIIRSEFKVALAPKAIVCWMRPNALGEFWREQFGYGRGRGEALLTTPFVIRLNKRGQLPAVLAPVLNGFRWAFRGRTLKAFFNSLINFDFLIALFILLLYFGNGYYFAKGYLIGDAYGEEHCKGVRSRLSHYPDKQTAKN